MCQFEAVLRSKMQVRIPRSQIDKLACQAKSVGITERSEVTLSLRPYENNPNILLLGEAFELFVLFEYPNFNSKK